ncbi:MAG: NAD(P)H-dependent oxidoreductase [Desulfovibrio sp.]|nr:NAD(P)H-dependent oxidoreductase [Desulfovibrio sp.]
MRDVLLIRASPHDGGVSDGVSKLVAKALEKQRCSVTVMALRQHTITPCNGCGGCARPPHTCVFSKKDEAQGLLDQIAGAGLVVFCSPIYFYALPAQSKALVDRAQSFFQRQPSREMERLPSVCVLNAARTAGAELFRGTLLTLTYFFQALGRELIAEKTLRGLETRDDLQKRREILPEIDVFFANVLKTLHESQ